MRQLLKILISVVLLFNLSVSVFGSGSFNSTSATLTFGGIYDQKIEYDVNDNPIYIGYAYPGTSTSEAGWIICKLEWDANGNMITKRWAIVTTTYSDKFDKIWDNRASYPYSGL